MAATRSRAKTASTRSPSCPRVMFSTLSWQESSPARSLVSSVGLNALISGLAIQLLSQIAEQGL